MEYTVYFQVETYYKGEPKIECGFINADTLAEAARHLQYALPPESQPP